MTQKELPMPHYKQLNLYEREEISRGLSQGLSFREIANLTNRSASTISRELNRNLNNSINYRASHAQIRATHLNHKPRRKIKLKNNKRLLKFIVKHLYKRWSPEQIAKNRSDGWMVASEPVDQDEHTTNQVWNKWAISPSNYPSQTMTFFLNVKSP